MKGMIIFLSICFIAAAFAQEFPVGSSPHAVSQMWTTPVDREKPETVIVNSPVWNSLQRMTQQEKVNSNIDLVLEKNATPQAEKMASAIEELWNSGKYDNALSMFPQLGTLTNLNEMSIGNSWHTPVPTLDASKWGADVRIGNRDSILVNALDIDRATGNLFAVFLLQGDGNTNHWVFNISTDGGLTWNETYDWWANYSISTMSASVVSGYCYVAFHRGSSHDQAFLYRFDAINGIQTSFSTGTSYFTVFTTTSPVSITEVALTSNADYYNNRLYYSAINSDGSVKFFWGLDPDFVTWTEITTNVTDASHGLDISSVENYSTRYCWASYISSSDTVHIDGVQSGDTWDKVMSYPVGASGDYSSIGAYGDTVTCYFDYTATRPVCLYLVTYDDGGTWYYGFADDTTTIQESPAITARKGGGVGVVYRYYTPQREERFRWRNYRGTWTTQVSLADNEPYYNQPSIEYLGSDLYGVVYLSWTSPVVRGAFFDRSDFVSAVNNDPGGRLAESFHLFQNYPNPFNPSTTIAFDLPASNLVRLDIYDLNGRKIKTLLNQQQQAGLHQVVWDGSDEHGVPVASGVYIYRLNAGSVTASQKMILLK